MTTPTTALINTVAYTNTRWRECVIWLACEGGSVRETKADVYGAFGVHEAPHEIHEGVMSYAVTHIPTGKRVYSGGVSCWWWVEWATALGDWNTRSAAKLKRLKEAM